MKSDLFMAVGYQRQFPPFFCFYILSPFFICLFTRKRFSFRSVSQCPRLEKAGVRIEMQKPCHYEMHLKKGGVVLSLQSDDGAFVSEQSTRWKHHMFEGVRFIGREEALSQTGRLSLTTHEEIMAYVLTLMQGLGRRAEQGRACPEKIFAFPENAPRPSEAALGEPAVTVRPSVSPSPPEQRIDADASPAPIPGRREETISTQCAILPDRPPEKPAGVLKDEKRLVNSQKGICFLLFFIVLYFTLISVRRFLTTPVDNVNAQEAAYDIAEAYAAWLEHHVPDEETTAGAFTPYMHIMEVDTSSHLSDVPVGQSSLEPCSKTRPCLVLYNGGVVQYNIHNCLGRLDAAKTNGWLFNIDPDGAGVHNGALTVVQHADGRLETAETAIQKPLIYEGPAIRVIGHNPSYVHNWKMKPPSKSKKLLVETRKL
jgi:hypothetical protein